MCATDVECYTTNVVLFDCVQEASDAQGRPDPGERKLKQTTQFRFQAAFEENLHRASHGVTICVQLFIEP